MIRHLAFHTNHATAEMVDALMLMLDVRAQWVMYRGEPRTPQEREAMAHAVSDCTRRRLTDPDAPLVIDYRLCGREGCSHPVKGRQRYCDDRWCRGMRRSDTRRRWYEKKVATPDGKAALRKQSREACEAIRKRRREAGLTRDGLPMTHG